MSNFRRIKRIVTINCKECDGKGYRHANTGARVPCAACKGSGEVERWIVEIVQDDNETHTP